MSSGDNITVLTISNQIKDIIYTYEASLSDTDEEEVWNDNGYYLQFYYRRICWKICRDLFENKKYSLVSFDVTKCDNGKKLKLAHFNHYNLKNETHARISFYFDIDDNVLYKMEAVYKKSKSTSTIHFIKTVRFRKIDNDVVICEEK